MKKKEFLEIFKIYHLIKFSQEYLIKIYHPEDKMTIDKYILSMAENKSEIISHFEKALKESAVDCKLNYHGIV